MLSRRLVRGFVSQVATFLGQQITPPGPLRFARATGSRLSGPVNLFRRGYAVFQEGHSWRVLTWVLVRAVIGPLASAVVVLPALLLLAPLWVLADAAGAVPIPIAGKEWLLLGPLGLVAWPVLRRATRALAALHLRLAGWALGPGRAEIAAAGGVGADRQVARGRGAPETRRPRPHPSRHRRVRDGIRAARGAVSHRPGATSIGAAGGPAIDEGGLPWPGGSMSTPSEPAGGKCVAAEHS